MKQLIDLLYVIKHRFITWIIVLFYDIPQKRFIIKQDLPINNNGFETTSSKELFNCSISEIAKNSGLSDLKYDKNGLYFTSKLPEKLLEVILTSKKLENLIFSYLGKDARLDDIYIKCQAPNSKSISEGWHTDNVGYRLKMFIAFDAKADSPKTILIPKSHLKVYSFPFLEILKRFFLKNNSSFFKKMISNNFTHFENEVKLAYADDVIHIFDTNALHRGDYAKYLNSRNCIVVEFINRDKGNKLFKYAPCGPGQQDQGMLFFSPGISNYLINSKLIDKNILKVEKNPAGFVQHYCYSINNLN